MTQPNADPQVVSLHDLIAQGGEAGRLGFHLMSIDYHATAIRQMAGKEELELLLDMLTQEAMPIYALLETSENLEVVKPTLIVPGRYPKGESSP